MMIDLSGKRALITGGSKGIGYATARKMAESGADVILLARNVEQLTEAANGLAYTGRSIETCVFDLRDFDNTASVYAKLTADGRGIDILVANAGVNLRGPAESIELDVWNSVMGLNVTSVFLLCQEFARERIARGAKGKIVTLASLMSESVRSGCAPYATSKGAIRQMTKALAVEWAKHGINVNAIAPGYTRTEMNEPLYNDQEFNRWVVDRTPMGRWAEPEEIAGLAVVLASDVTDFVTGQTICIDGGLLSRY